jgi:hypothetical protein
MRDCMNYKHLTKGCVAWQRPSAFSFHQMPHRLGPSCKKKMTNLGEVGHAILVDRARIEKEVV